MTKTRAAVPPAALLPPPAALAQLRAAAGRACALLKVMAHEDRLLLLCQLAEGECNVGQLQQATGIVQPTLSQQLGVLRDEGLVETRREGKYVHYRLASAEVIAMMHALHASFCTPPSRTPSRIPSRNPSRRKGGLSS